MNIANHTQQVPKKATIAHISDLHLSSADAWQNFNALRTAIVQIEPKPSAIIASGDFLDHPDPAVVVTALRKTIAKIFRQHEQPKSLAYVREQLVQLCRDCGETCQLIVVPGNHDCRMFGLTSWKNQTAKFNKVFKDWGNSLLFLQDVRPVAIFCLDSNTNDPRINAARGRIGKEEYNRFAREFEKLQRSNGEIFNNAFKIVVLHHHPLPIANAEEEGFFATDAFLGLDDAGIFMREMASRGIDLVLHGHKHYSFNAGISVAAGRILHNLTILAAGSASKSGRGNSFNLITIEPSAVSNEVFVRPTGFAFLREGTCLPILSYEKFRDQSHESFVHDSEKRLIAERFTISYSMLEYGDCDVANERRGLKTKSSAPVSRLPIYLSSPFGTYADYQPVRISGPMVDVQFEPDAECGDGVIRGNIVRGNIVFDPPLNSDSEAISLEETYRLYNGFALTQAQRRRMTEGKEIKEEVGIYFKKNPVKEVVICVHFGHPGVDFPPGFRPVAYAEDTKVPNLKEFQLCQRNLVVSRLTKTVTLTVPKPLRGVMYGFEWDLPPGAQSKLSLLHQGQCDEIRKRLLALTRQSDTNPLQSIFEKKHKQLSNEYQTQATETLHLGMMVHDPKIGKLRYVAGIIEKQYWDYHLWEGQGIAGRAHKLKSALTYFPSKTEPKMRFAAAPPFPLDMPSILICIPVLYPVSQVQRDAASEILGVITLSTTYNASNLLKIEADENRQKAMALEFQIFFLKEILPALGLADFIDKAIGA